MLLATPLYAEETSITQDAAVRKFVHDLSARYPFNTTYLYTILGKAKFNQEIIDKMNTPYEEKSWIDYKKHFITPSKILNGVYFWDEHKHVLEMAEQKYGIPADIIVAILGMETQYGKKQGTFNVLDTLMTLAFYYPPKRTFFQKELGNFLILTHQFHLDLYSLKGSYAGALGIPQFMPSSYLAYAVSYSPSKKPNLFINLDDAIVSVANFLMQQGWERDEPIAVEAKVLGEKYQAILKKDSRKPQQPTLNLEDLAEYQVYSDDPQDSRINGYWKANLMQFKNEKPEYWLGFQNFHVLTLYNNSDQYAMSAFQLGKTIQKAYRDYLSSKAKGIQKLSEERKHQG